MARARRFYETVFQAGLQRLDGTEFEMWGFPMDRGAWGAAGALVRIEGVPSGGNSTLVYFSCEDCAAEAGRVLAAGGAVHRDKFSIGQYGFIALAVDSEGNMFGLHSLR
jgi:predicted enzyme related to lactoylglutathione lyase